MRYLLHPGRFLATSIWGPFDSFTLGLSRLWMPWRGKVFDRETQEGVNRFVQAAASRVALKAVFPSYRPERSTSDRIEALSGSLVLASSPGQGTHLHVTLPLADPAPSDG